MSINWVMTSPSEQGFVKLPNERILYTSPPRCVLQISTSNTVPGVQPFSVKSDSGVVYITNQRVVYLPSNPTTEFQSFSSPILKLQDTHVRAPFFGANYWTAVCRPVPGGGISADYPSVNLVVTFRDGGAFDFHTTFEQIKERVYQVYQVTRESGVPVADLANIDLEQLPAYEAARELPGDEAASAAAVARESEPSRNTDRDEGFQPPIEPPPGYEEAQVQAVGIDLDQRLREEAERR